jgi:putative ABC transport system ATP-binding protein
MNNETRQADACPMIQMDGITKSYRTGENAVHALQGVNLTIHENDYISIVGASGSGKTTLMSIMGCLDSATDGAYTLNNRDVSKLNQNKLAEIRNKEIGFVFQSYNLLPYATALENVELPLLYGNMSGKKRKARAKELLEQVGLGHRINHKATELSGGEMQRVAIARALSNDPAILLGDEPTGNLDSKSGKEIMGIFEDLWKQGHTVVLITHDANVAARASRQVRIQDGEIVNDA